MATIVVAALAVKGVAGSPARSEYAAMIFCGQPVHSDTGRSNHILKPARFADFEKMHQNGSFLNRNIVSI